MTDERSDAKAKWENLVIELDMTDSAESKAILDRHGTDLWELVSVVYVQPIKGVTGLAFLKRRASV